MKSPLFYIKNPNKLGLAIIKYFEWLPDKIYLKIRYKLQTGEKLNLKNPRTFNEKLQWLKLYDFKPEYSVLVDKIAVKDYVANLIGKNYIIPTLKIWNSVEEIDYSQLPDQFVLKTTHGGGGCGIVICRDKEKLDKKGIGKKLAIAFSKDISKIYREIPYKNVPKRVMAESLISVPEGKDLNDYKIFCFNGVPRFIKVDFDRFIDHHANYYDLEWKLLPFGEADLPPVPEIKIELPKNLTEMIEIARTLSAGHKFLRVDLYNVDGKIYFGELTFYPASGMGHFTSKEWEYKVGDMLNLK